MPNQTVRVMIGKNSKLIMPGHTIQGLTLSEIVPILRDMVIYIAYILSSILRLAYGSFLYIAHVNSSYERCFPGKN